MNHTDKTAGDKATGKPSNPDQHSHKDLEVKTGADSVKGGRPVRKGGDPEDGGE
ncbi:MAG: hypothetical protein ABJC74_15420 [Gemmatimonadota bacterium]